MRIRSGLGWKTGQDDMGSLLRPHERPRGSTLLFWKAEVAQPPSGNREGPHGPSKEVYATSKKRGAHQHAGLIPP